MSGLGNFSMWDLFRGEVDTQMRLFVDSLLAIEGGQSSTEHLASAMRAAHSIKGAARIVQLDPGVRLAHVMEDCLVAAQEGALQLSPAGVDVLLNAGDMLTRLAAVEEADVPGWCEQHSQDLDELVQRLGSVRAGTLTESAPATAASVSASVPEAVPPGPLPPTPASLEDFSMWELFRGEVESQMQNYTDALLAIEGGGDTAGSLAASMRAAHSIKGAARIVQFDAGVRLAHAMEDCLVRAQDGTLQLAPWSIDVLLSAGDLLHTLAKVPETGVGQWLAERETAIDDMIGGLEDVRAGKERSPVTPAPVPEPVAQMAVQPASSGAPAPSSAASGASSATQERTLRVGAQALNRVMAFAGESLVQSRWFEPYGDSLLALKRLQYEMSERLEAIEESLGPSAPGTKELVTETRDKLELMRKLTAESHVSLETFALRSSGLSDRLYREVVSTRMRPFGEGVEGFPRLVRDVARQLGKQAQIEITGRQTKVDREILERLEAPLNHSIRNCLDHGLELPDERVSAGKPAMGTIRVDARHRAGLFVLTVSDDGRGVNLERLRQKVLDRGLATAEMAAKFSDEELIEFLFLPGFSTAAKVTDISGRGVGLDAVQDMAKSVGGSVRMTSRAGQGITLTLELPLTLSVLRTLVAEIGGEPFAFPLTKIAKTVVVPYEEFVSLEGQHYFTLDGERIGVVSAHELLGLPQNTPFGSEVNVVLLGERNERYGLAVDRFRGEHDMVVRPLDSRLGKIQDVSASAVMEDGSPILILDVDDLIRSIATELQGGRLRGIGRGAAAEVARRRILIVEDSITVREVERALLKNSGYEVEVAVDGMDGWNALRSGQYDLVITDIDMPRMTGLELVSLIRADSRLLSIPVIIVSYKDREEDRMKGLEVGADRYMTKSSFHDQTLLKAVVELIGAPA